KRCPGCKCQSDCCDGCPCGRCGHPRTKRILMKKIITEEKPTTKCVVEEIVELVPVKIYHKVPCEEAPCLQAAPPPILAPAADALPLPTDSPAPEVSPGK